MSQNVPDTDLPFSDDDLTALEAALEHSLDQAELGEDSLLPPLHVYQEARRQRQRHRPEAARKPRDVYHHGNLRQSLIGIAMGQAEHNGLSKVSLRGIAREAGVSAPALYRHFKDKEALLAAVAEHGFEELSDWLSYAAPEEFPVLVRLNRLFQAYLEFMQSYPLYYQLMFGSEVHSREQYPALQKAQEQMLKPLVAIVLAGRSQGLFHLELEAETQVLNCWTALHGFTSLVVMGVIHEDKQELIRHLEQLIQGLLRGIQAQA